MNTELKAQKARNLRYKRSALASMGYETIVNDLYEIQEACTDIHYFMDTEDGSLLEALLGDEEDEWEFKMAFADLEVRCEQLLNCIGECVFDDDNSFDDCTVALIGNRYNLVGYDSFEEDYFSMCSYEEGLAQTEAGKRLMRYTKAEMISRIGQAFGVLMAYIDLRSHYDNLKAAIDILRDENSSLLKTIKEIDEAYEKAAEIDFFPQWADEVKHFDRLIRELPDRIWIE